MKICICIKDTPFSISTEELFRIAEEEELDGLEICYGLRAVFQKALFMNLLKKYSLKVLTVHQPHWSVFNLHPDAPALRLAADLHAQYIFYPPYKAAYNSPYMHEYFSRIANLGKATHTPLLIENIPVTSIKGGKSSDYAKEFTDLRELGEQICSQFSTRIAFDIASMNLTDINTIKGYRDYFRFVEVIRIHDFSTEHSGLQLFLQEFFLFLNDIHYSGTITFVPANNPTYLRQEYYRDCREALLIIKRLVHQK